jgi:hypothetical protein
VTVRPLLCAVNLTSSSASSSSVQGARPAPAGWSTGGRHQLGFLLAGKLALRTGNAALRPARAQVAFDEAPLGLVDRVTFRCLKSRLPGANLLWDNATKRDLANAVMPTSTVVARVIFSSAVAKAGRNSIDGELDGPQNLLIGVGPAIFPHQLNLNVVQRVEIGNSITDGTLQKRIAL